MDDKKGQTGKNYYGINHKLLSVHISISMSAFIINSNEYFLPVCIKEKLSAKLFFW